MNILLYTFIATVLIVDGGDAGVCNSRNLKNIDFFYGVAPGCRLIFQKNITTLPPEDIFKQTVSTGLGPRLTECSAGLLRNKPIIFVNRLDTPHTIFILYYSENKKIVRLIRISTDGLSKQKQPVNVHLDELPGHKVEVVNYSFDSCHVNTEKSLKCYELNEEENLVEHDFQLNEDNIYVPTDVEENSLPRGAIAEHVPVGSFRDGTGSSNILLPHVMKWLWRFDPRAMGTAFHVINVPTKLSQNEDQFPLIISADKNGIVTALCEDVIQKKKCRYYYTYLTISHPPVCFYNSSSLLSISVLSHREMPKIQGYSGQIQSSESNGGSTSTNVSKSGDGSININTRVNLESKDAGLGALGLLWFIPLLILVIVVLMCILFFILCCMRERSREKALIVETQQTKDTQTIPVPIKVEHRCDLNHTDFQQMIDAIKELSKDSKRHSKKTYPPPPPPPPPFIHHCPIILTAEQQKPNVPPPVIPQQTSLKVQATQKSEELPPKTPSNKSPRNVRVRVNLKKSPPKDDPEKTISTATTVTPEPHTESEIEPKRSESVMSLNGYQSVRSSRGLTSAKEGRNTVTPFVVPNDKNELKNMLQTIKEEPDSMSEMGTPSSSQINIAPAPFTTAQPYPGYTPVKRNMGNRDLAPPYFSGMGAIPKPPTPKPAVKIPNSLEPIGNEEKPKAKTPSTAAEKDKRKDSGRKDSGKQSKKKKKFILGAPK